MATSYEPVIGLEIHAQLLTFSKLFCGCSTEYGKSPNSNVCPVCLGLPGALPVLNRGAVEMAVRAALALGCTVHEKSVFARKNYFYPDLPKGYQISQYEQPLATSGHLDVEGQGKVTRVSIQRIHMEEDAGKNTHGVGGNSLVDLNRAGVPLVEIVSGPDIHSSEDAAAYMRALRDVLVFLGVNDGNLEEGSLRCDANVSLRPKGSKTLGTRCELKNLNSFRFVARAIEAEIARQSAVLDAGGSIEQETRSFDPDSGTTATLRSKEDAHDYRYFPDPDLPTLQVSDEVLRDARSHLAELPAVLRRRWAAELGLSPQATATLTAHPAYVRFFNDTLALFGHPIKVANWIQTEVLRDTTVHGLRADFPVSPAQVAELLELVESGRISGKQAKEVSALMTGTSKRPAAIVEEQGLQLLSNADELEPMCRALIDKHPKEAAFVRAGKTGVLGFFVGQIMKQTKGSADPKLVSGIFQKLLSEDDT